MRISALAGLALLAIGSIAATGSAKAQTYDPNYPVCLQVFAPGQYFDCRYTSMQQCRETASGRAAECTINPYFANAYREPLAPRHRRHRHAY